MQVIREGRIHVIVSKRPIRFPQSMISSMPVLKIHISLDTLLTVSLQLDMSVKHFGKREHSVCEGV